MRLVTHKSLLLAAFALGSACQLTGQTVSPRGFNYEKQWGNVSSSSAFGDRIYGYRHQQLHGDMKGLAMTINSIAFRQGRSVHSAAGKKDVTVELWMGESDFAARSTSYLGNYLSPPTRVMASRTVHLPRWTQARSTVGPFEVVLPLDKPFVHTGHNTLGWHYELKTQFLTKHYVDAHRSYLSKSNTSVSSGKACTVTGQTNPLVYRVTCMAFRKSKQSTRDEHILMHQGWNAAPLHGASFFAMAAGPDTVSVPGLCTDILRDIFWIRIAQPQRNGTAYSMDRAPFDPRLVGVTFHSQWWVVDLERADAIKLAGSGIAKTSMPAQPPVLAPILVVSGVTNQTRGMLLDGRGNITQFR